MPQNPYDPRKNPIGYLDAHSAQVAQDATVNQHATFTFRPKTITETREKLNLEKAEAWNRESSRLASLHPGLANIKTVEPYVYVAEIPASIMSSLLPKKDIIQGASRSINKTRAKEYIKTIDASDPKTATDFYRRLPSHYRDYVFKKITTEKQSQIFNSSGSDLKNNILDLYKDYRPVRSDIVIATDQDTPSLTLQDLKSDDLPAKLLEMGYTPETYARISDEIKSRYYNQDTGQWDNPQAKTAYENAQQGYNEAREYLENPQTNSQAQSTIDKHHHDPRLLTFSKDGLPTPVAAALAAAQAASRGNPDIYQDQALSHYMTDNAPNAQSGRALWSRHFYQLKQHASKFNLQTTTNSSGQLIMGGKNAISRLKNALSGVKTLSSQTKKIVNQAPKKLTSNLIKRGLKNIAVKLGLEGVIGGIATGGTTTVIMLSLEGLKLLKKYWKLAFSNLFLGVMKINDMINPISWANKAWGGTTNAAGASAHAVTSGTGVIRTPVYDPSTGQVIAVKQSTLTSPINISTAIPEVSTTFLLTTTVAPFLLIMVLTLIVMTQILTAFTVPNPLPTQFGSPDTSKIPGYAPDPTNPGSAPDPNRDASNPPASIKNIIQQAAKDACLPSAYLSAVLQTEAGGIFGYSDTQATEFNTANWWLTASSTGGNCYNTHELSGKCGVGPSGGYCYNTCAPAGLCAPNSDVRGGSQFLSTTFYGGACNNLEGLSPACKNPGTPAYYIAVGVQDDITYVPNRCKLSDAINASAFKLSSDSGATIFGPDYSCTYNTGRWNPITDKATICLTARAYCGSCGAIENPTHPLYGTGQPCEAYYGTSGSSACGGPSTIGYCNLVYNRYLENLR